MTHRADPLYSQRNPYQIFLLGLSVLASIPLLRGNAGSGLLERELDDRTVIAWGVALLSGSIIALLGEFWPVGHTWAGLVLASIPLLRGNAGSGLLERELDDRTVIAWGAALLSGSIVALLGEFWPAGHTWAGLVLERAGLGLVGGAAAVYAGVVLASVSDRTDVSYLTAIQIAYALSCGWRCLQISQRLAWIRVVVEDYDRASGS